MNEKKEEPKGTQYYKITNPDLSNEHNEHADPESLRNAIATSSEVFINSYQRLEGTFSPEQKTLAGELNLRPTVEEIDTNIKKLLNGQKEQSEHSKKEAIKEGIRFRRGVILGLLLGIFGNLVVSYTMKTLEIFNITYPLWIVATIIGIVLTILLVIIIEKKM
jgi:uncharacterized membrane protein YeaQ/YmgE (transglycosylase-associated protein family)